LRRRRKIWIALIAVVAAAVIVRAALPWVVTDYVNGKLANMGEYRGHVDNVDLSLIRGAYVLRDVRVVKRRADVETPFAQMDRMDLSIQWPALLEGELVGEIIMQSPVVNMVQGERESQTQLGTGVNWPERVRDLFPFNFNRVEVVNGLVTFRAPGIETDESLTLRNLRVVLTDLTNVRETQETAFAELALRGDVMGDAPLVVNGRINPNAEVPTFDIDLSLEGARLVEVNPWLDEFLGVDAERGAFSMYTEIAAADGRFEGYVRPIMENPEIFRKEEAASGPFRKAWEALVGLAMKVFQNAPQDQVATQVPLSGEVENPDAGVLAAGVNLVRNAFVAAFSHALEGSVSLKTVDPEAEESE
jgi:hypothetical protein